MKSIRKESRLVLCVMTVLCLACSISCDDRAAKQAEARYYQRQQEILEEQSAEWYQQQEEISERQKAEWERQLKRGEAQDSRHEALLTKWEEQTRRVDTLLNRWDRILGVLEERSHDR